MYIGFNVFSYLTTILAPLQKSSPTLPAANEIKLNFYLKSVWILLYSVIISMKVLETAMCCVFFIRN